ncbi:MAG: hypothetical protein MN733_14185 [Nitrososphaera sp.]|nr:hypothetical protein [Nitrososphaera sp.]
MTDRIFEKWFVLPHTPAAIKAVPYFNVCDYNDLTTVYFFRLMLGGPMHYILVRTLSQDGYCASE